MRHYILLLFLTGILSLSFTNLRAQCFDCLDSDVLTFYVDLSSTPDTIWTSSSVVRSGTCCASTDPPCVRFIVYLHPQADEFSFQMANGASPPGMEYQVNCQDTFPAGAPICVPSADSLCILYCKPGGNANAYEIATARNVYASPDITLSMGCTGMLTLEGIQESSITWNSIYPGLPGDYNSYLSCTANCDTTYVTAPAGYPDSVIFVGAGTPTGCSSTNTADTVTVHFVTGMTVAIDPAEPAICFGGTDVTITANVTGGAPPYSYLWNTTETTQSITVGVGTYYVEVTDTTQGCPPGRDTVTVIAHPSAITASAGVDDTVCTTSPDYTLNGSIGIATGGIWSGGTGTFTPDNTTLNATYTPTAAEISAGTVTLTLTSTGNGGCPAVSDNMTLTILPEPVVAAGTDQTVCASSPNVSLSGSVTVGSTTGNWTSSGTGTFAPSSTDLNATYSPSAADISAGSVTLTLTATNSCNPLTDNLIVTILPEPIVSAGTDQTVCANNATVSLSGSVTGGGTAGQWSSSGTGTFTPSNTDLNATYNPSAADITTGTVTITLTATDGCAAIADNMVITITPAPLVSAGTDQTVCGVGPTVNLSGSVTGGATTGQWSSSGTGTFTPSNTDLNATYNPSTADITAGTVTLTLTSTLNGTCLAESDNMIITITPPPIVDAGTDQTVCGNNADVSLSGSITGGATTGQWTTSGTGTFAPSNTDLNATYTPSSADTATGTITLTLSSTDGCSNLSDAMTITITPAPYVNAGADQIVCESSPATILSGIVSGGATTGQWSSSGTGTFTPSNADLNATYNPSAADITAGTVTLTLTSTLNGTCLAETDNMIITISPSPIVSAGADQNICEGDDVTLSGSVTVGGSAGQWSGGTGTYTPSITDLNATYTPSAAEITAGTVTLTLTATDGCAPVNDDILITITPVPVVSAGIDQTICESSNASLNGSVTIGGSAGNWTTSGTGSFSPNSTTLNADYIPSAADITAGTITLTLNSTDGCAAISDVMTLNILPLPVVNAGTDQTVCEATPDVNLSGSVTIGGSAGQWSGGTGTFSPSNTDLNATYTPSAAEITTGTVTLTLTATDGCSPETDQMTITITPAPIVNAGADQTVCANNAVVTLNGSVTAGGSAGQWSTSGTGTFSNNTDLNATYTPSDTDTTVGSVTITLTSTDGCAAVSDIMIINFTPAPLVNAGPDQISCEATPATILNGSVSAGASTGQWSSAGTGSFSPSNTNLGATYNPSAADLTTGSVIITLTSTGNGACLAESDDMQITFSPAPVVDAGTDLTICEGDDATLNGSVTVGGSAGLWSGGTGTFTPSNTVLNATYTPSAAEVTAGTVTLTLTATDGCAPINDNIVITITPAPVVNAGTDQTVCANNADVSLTGTVTVGGSTGQWSTSGTGLFNPSNTNLNATYSPSAADITSGSVTLTLTSTDGCVAVSDNMIVNITPAPVVDAGIDQTICGDGSSATLNGSVTGGATTGQWSSSGTGSFDNNTNLNAIYTPSPADISAGSVTLTLTSTLNGNCLAETDQMTITITPAPVVNAGSNQTVCANNANVSLSGSITGGGSTGIWSTSGTGSFTPSNTDLNATYIPSNADTALGTITLTLTATDGCAAITDNMTVIITPAPYVNAGTDQIICESSPVTSLSGIVSGGSNTGQWTTSGTGTFTPSNTDLNADYNPSAADISTGTVLLTLTSTANGTCLAESDDMQITITPAPIVTAGSDQTVCEASPDVNLNGSVTAGSTTGIWTSNGTGIFTPSNTDLNATYTPSAADITAGSVILTLTATGGCAPIADNLVVTITPLPIVNAGADQTICETAPSINLTGLISGGGSTGLWTSSGTGTFGNPNNLNTIYTPSAADIATVTTTITLTSTDGCFNLSDDLILTIHTEAIVDAGIDQTLCSNNALVSLSGAISGSTTTGIWSSGGTGTFSSTTSLNTMYIPSNADTANGSVTITLTSTNNGACSAISDNLTVTLTPGPFVNAGTDEFVCANNPDVILNGNIWGANTTGIWTTDGSGTFSPDNTTLNATYIPSNADTANGIVNIYLTSTNVGSCLAVTDTMVITITPAPSTIAGSNIYICKDDSAQLAGQIILGAGTGTWTTTGTGTFIPDANDLNAVYAPSGADTLLASLEFVLTSTNNGGCNAVSDTLILTFTERPNVTAGIDQVICANNTADLTGSVSGSSTTGQWLTSGSGTFLPSDTSLTASYYPSAADAMTGSVTLTLISTYSCYSSDDLTITLDPPPVVDAGTDFMICENQNSVNLNGNVSGATTTGIWTSTGTGTFIPDNTTLNATYNLSPADISSGNISLILTSTNNGDCNAEADTVNISLDRLAVVNAGPDVTLCSNNATVDLTGLISGGTSTGNWTSSGTGTFTPSNTDLTCQYLSSFADTAVGSITLTLSSTNNGACPVITDDLTISYTPSPSVFAGSDISVCANNATISLNGSIAGGATQGTWSTTGTGSFSPSVTDLITSYIPSIDDTVNGALTLILTSTDNGNCLAVSDSLDVIITEAPIMEAGLDQTICSGETVALSGYVNTIATGGNWTTSGDGTFSPSASDLNATYIPGTGDTSNHNVTLYLTTTGVGNCLPVTDSIVVNITPRPNVDAGIDQTICSSSSATLSGLVSGSSNTGFWSTTGSGTFTPDSTNFGAEYIPSTLDTSNGSVLLILTATNACYNSDTMNLIFTSAPFADAGTDEIICASDNQVNLNGVVYGATSTGIWSTTGTGSFSPDNTTLVATYNVSSADSLAGYLELILTTTNNGICSATSDTISITITDIPIVDAGADQTICANNFASLTGNINISAGEWTSLGTGSFQPNNSAMNAVYIPSDADTTAGFVQLILSSVATCQIISDTMDIIITPAPQVDAGPDQTVCANNASVLLSGNVWGATTTGLWTTSGTGSFVPSNTDLNATYIPSDADTAAGSVELILESTNYGNCLPEYDTLMVTITDIPVVNAGQDQTICSGDQANLSGSVISVSGEGIWTTNGDGTFTPVNTSLNANYNPGFNDGTNGSVTLYLTSTNIGNCIAIMDSLIIDIVPRPTVDAGLDQTICSNNTALLSGSVSGSSTTGYWTSSGSGIFNPDSSDFNAGYIPSNADTTAGIVSLYLIATNSCYALDSMELTLTDAPIVNAGPDAIICATDDYSALSGTISGATTTGIWTTLGSGIFIPGATNLNTSYYVSFTDSAAGSVDLVLISTNNGTCLAESDTMSIIITDVPTVVAGADQTVCANNDVLLSGTINGIVTTGMWSSTGTGYFTPDSTDLNANYIFSPADTSNGYVKLILQSTGSCETIYDTISVSITPAPQVNAGVNIAVCANNADVVLSGNVWGATTTGQWSSLGTGTFIPSNTDLNATYVPSNADTAAGSVIITLNATNIGTCAPASDNLTITYTVPPTAVAGSDIVACNDGNVLLQGGVLNGSGTGIWSTNGTGTFVPSDTVLSATYIPSVADTIIGAIQMILTTTHNGGCLSDSDTIDVTFTPRPYVYAGIDIAVCSNDSIAYLSGIVSGSASTGFWETAGSGYFMPDSSNLNVEYILSNADLDSGYVYLTLTSSNACASVDSIYIEVLPAPIVDAGPDQAICPGTSSVILTGNVTGVDSTGIWTTTGTGAFIPNDTTLGASYILSPADTATGIISLILTSTGSGYCGSSSDTMNITVSPGPIINAGQDIVTCANATVTLNATSTSSNNTWFTTGSGSFADPNSLTSTYNFSNADTSLGYVILVLNSTNACGFTDDSVFVSITPAPVVDAGPDMMVCANYPDVIINGYVGSGATTGIWSSSGTGIFSPSNTDLNTTYIPDSADTVAGTVTLYLTSTNNGNCIPVTDSLVITINPAPFVFAGNDQTICNGSIVNLDGAITSLSGSGQWSTMGDGTFSPNDTTLLGQYTGGNNDLLLGEVTLILEATDMGGCMAEPDTMVATFVSANSGAELVDAISLCAGDSIFLTPVITGDTGTISWYSMGGGTFAPFDTVFNVNYLPDSSDFDSGQVWLYMDYSFVCGNIHDSVLLSLNPNPVAGFEALWNCKDNILTFRDTSELSSGSVFYWDWDFGNGSSGVDSVETIEYFNLGDYTVSLVVQSDSGCSDTIVSNIYVWEPVIADFSVQDTNVFINEEISFTDESFGAISWNWDFGDGSGTSSDQHPYYTFTSFGDYDVWLYISGENGCLDSTYQTIHTTDNGFGIPTGFSPNSDNLNDEFSVRGGPFTKYELRVFNSWGQQIFRSLDQSYGWDGTYKGKDQPEGVYIYIFIGETYDGTVIEKTGDITLIR